MKTSSMILAALIALAVGAARLSAAEGAPAPTGPYADDLTKFCKDVGAGGGRRAKCLKEHESDLSASCKAQLDAAQKRGAHAEACKSDIEKFCKDIPRGGGRVKKCLLEHKSDLSTDCKTSISGR